jgi:hypothetical protein
MDGSMHYRSGEKHTSMRGRKIPHREPEQHEENYHPRHEPHAPFGSPAAGGGMSMGPGPLPGAGELPGRGPGAAARDYAQRDPSESPVAKTPSPKVPGMRKYMAE